MALILPADGVRAPSETHTLFALARAICAPVTACNANFPEAGTIVKTLLDQKLRYRIPSDLTPLGLPRREILGLIMPAGKKVIEELLDKNWDHAAHCPSRPVREPTTKGEPSTCLDTDQGKGGSYA